MAPIQTLFLMINQKYLVHYMQEKGVALEEHDQGRGCKMFVMFMCWPVPWALVYVWKSQYYLGSDVGPVSY